VLGIGLIAYSLLTDFADETANVWVPHLVVGLAAIFLGLTTKEQAGSRYRKTGADTATRATA
jgi:hypothetical protein